MRGPGPRALLALLILNVVLQCYDGVSTYLGLQAGLVQEGNPLLCTACVALGPAAALGISKLVAVWMLLAIWRLRHKRLAPPALGFIGAYYTVIALAPWVVTFAS